MEEKYILELSRDEIIMIQELSSDTDCSYVWMHYYLKVDEAVADEMARAKRCELSFHYQITEE